MAAITLTHDTEIDAPADAVWAVVADYSRDPEWRTGVISMVPSPPGLAGIGTTTAEEIRVAGTTWRNGGQVTAVEPGARFEWHTTSGAIANGARAVEPLDARRCRVRLELNVTPSGANRLLSPLLARLLRRNLVRDAHRLRAIVEPNPVGDAAQQRS